MKNNTNTKNSHISTTCRRQHQHYPVPGNNHHYHHQMMVVTNGPSSSSCSRMITSASSVSSLDSPTTATRKATGRKRSTTSSSRTGTSTSTGCHGRSSSQSSCSSTIVRSPSSSAAATSTLRFQWFRPLGSSLGTFRLVVIQPPTPLPGRGGVLLPKQQQQQPTLSSTSSASIAWALKLDLERLQIQLHSEIMRQQQQQSQHQQQFGIRTASSSSSTRSSSCFTNIEILELEGWGTNGTISSSDGVNKHDTNHCNRMNYSSNQQKQQQQQQQQQHQLLEPMISNFVDSEKDLKEDKEGIMYIEWKQACTFLLNLLLWNKASSSSSSLLVQPSTATSLSLLDTTRGLHVLSKPKKLTLAAAPTPTSSCLSRSLLTTTNKTIHNPLSPCFPSIKVYGGFPSTYLNYFLYCVAQYIHTIDITLPVKSSTLSSSSSDLSMILHQLTCCNQLQSLSLRSGNSSTTTSTTTITTPTSSTNNTVIFTSTIVQQFQQLFIHLPYLRILRLYDSTIDSYQDWMILLESIQQSRTLEEVVIPNYDDNDDTMKRNMSMNTSTSSNTTTTYTVTTRPTSTNTSNSISSNDNSQTTGSNDNSLTTVMPATATTSTPSSFSLAMEAVQWHTACNLLRRGIIRQYQVQALRNSKGGGVRIIVSPGQGLIKSKGLHQQQQETIISSSSSPKQHMNEIRQIVDAALIVLNDWYQSVRPDWNIMLPSSSFLVTSTTAGVVNSSSSSHITHHHDDVECYCTSHLHDIILDHPCHHVESDQDSSK